jgi:hypothetical protein
MFPRAVWGSLGASEGITLGACDGVTLGACRAGWSSGTHSEGVSKWSYRSAANSTPPLGYPAGREVTPASPFSPLASGEPGIESAYHASGGAGPPLSEMPNLADLYIVTLAVTVTAEETPERGGEVRLGR